MFFRSGRLKELQADLDEVICNAMKGMQVQEEKKYHITSVTTELMGNYR